MEVLLAQDLTQVAVPQNVIITGVVVGIVVAIVSAVFPAIQAGRISPLEALRARSQAKEGCLVRMGWIPGLIIFLGATLVLIFNPFPYDVQFTLGSMAVMLLFLGGTL